MPAKRAGEGAWGNREVSPAELRGPALVQLGGFSQVIGDGPWRIYKAVRQTTETRYEYRKHDIAVVGREPADF